MPRLGVDDQPLGFLFVAEFFDFLLFEKLGWLRQNAKSAGLEGGLLFFLFVALFQLLIDVERLVPLIGFVILLLVGRLIVSPATAAAAGRRDRCQGRDRQQPKTGSQPATSHEHLKSRRGWFCSNTRNAREKSVYWPANRLLSKLSERVVAQRPPCWTPAGRPRSATGRFRPSKSDRIA